MICGSNIKTLVKKEFRSLQKNPSAAMLLGLLTAIALLISLTWTDPQSESSDSICWIVFPASEKENSFYQYLQERVPLDSNIQVGLKSEMPRHQTGRIALGPHDCAIELRSLSGSEFAGDHRIFYHHPVGHRQSIEATAAWFWPMWHQFEHPQVAYQVIDWPFQAVAGTGFADTLRDNAANNLDIGLVATMLLLAVQFFACCHLYVSFASQDRERGTLAALALSPASTTELLVARAIFHQSLGLGVSLLVLAIIQPSAILSGQLWLTLMGVGFAWMSVGTLITTFTKTQAQASMTMFCYMLGGSMLFFLASQFPAFRALQMMTFENHAVTLLHTGLAHECWLFLPGVTLTLLTCLWMVAAGQMFRRFGWQ